MKTTGRLPRVPLCALTLGLMLAFPALVQAEWYVAGQAGANVPNRLSETKGLSGGVLTGTTYTSQNLQTSLAYGAKLGYFFDSAKWLGVETEIFNSTPNLQQGQVSNSVNGTAYPTSGGSTLRVTTWATNLIARYPGKTFQPYVGAGLGVSWASLRSPLSSSNSNAAPGLNALAGLRVFMTQNVALFGEYKYNYTDFQFNNVSPTVGIQTRYSSNLFMGGLSLHF